MELVFGEYLLDTRRRELRQVDTVCPVEPQVFDLLAYLAQHRDRVVPRQELFDELWTGKVVTDSTLSSRIKAARQAVGDNGQSQHTIATVHGHGYRFIAEVTESGPSVSSDALAPPHQDQPTLVVLPFAHNPGSESAAWLAEVFSEDIGIALARIPGFVVISRNTAAYYSDREFTINQVGRELGTDYVIEGSVWEIGTRLRVAVQLLDTRTGQFVWADRSEIDADKLTDFQGDVIRNIVNRIEPELHRAELINLRQRRPVDLGAWALYRQAHATLSLHGWNEDSFAEAAKLLREAIARDPQLAFAHAYLSLLLALGHLIGLVTDDASRDEAAAAAETAINLDSNDSDVLGYAGCAFADLGEIPRGIGLMRRAVELDPSNAQARTALGAAMLRSGDPAGIEEMQKGIRISPRDTRLAVWEAVLARGLLSLGRVEDAIDVALHACSSDDKIFLPRLVLAIAQLTANQVDEARAALEDARRIRPHLSEKDFSFLAQPQEIESLRNAGLL